MRESESVELERGTSMFASGRESETENGLCESAYRSGGS